jgi:hypothetical protein
MVLVMARGEAGPVSRWPLKGCILSSYSKAKGDYQARVDSDQIVLVTVRQEAGPVAWWPKTLE